MEVNKILDVQSTRQCDTRRTCLTDLFIITVLLSFPDSSSSLCDLPVSTEELLVLQAGLNLASL